VIRDRVFGSALSKKNSWSISGIRKEIDQIGANPREFWMLKRQFFVRFSRGYRLFLIGRLFIRAWLGTSIAEYPVCKGKI
jgi:hypothetical protein